MDFTFSTPQQLRCNKDRRPEHDSKEDCGSPEAGMARDQTPEAVRVKRWMDATGNLDDMAIVSPPDSPLQEDHFNRWVAATARMQFTPQPSMASTPLTQSNAAHGQAGQSMSTTPGSTLTAMHAGRAAFNKQTPAAAAGSSDRRQARKTATGDMSVAFSDVSAAMSKLFLRDQHRSGMPAASPGPMAVSPVLVATAGAQMPGLDQGGVLMMVTGQRSQPAAGMPRTPVEAVLGHMAEESPEEVQPLHLRFEDEVPAAAGGLTSPSLTPPADGQASVWEQESDDELPFDQLVALTPSAGSRASELYWRAASNAAATPVTALLELMASPAQTNQSGQAFGESLSFFKE